WPSRTTLLFVGTLTDRISSLSLHDALPIYTGVQHDSIERAPRLDAETEECEIRMSRIAAPVDTHDGAFHLDLVRFIEDRQAQANVHLIPHTQSLFLPQRHTHALGRQIDDERFGRRAAIDRGIQADARPRTLAHVAHL